MDTQTATYSPEDNKLRLYPCYKLDQETYQKIKTAGFKWAPKQNLFVAPMWTPDREDILLELCEEIQDEDKSLTERAEERAERFQEYSHNRSKDAASTTEKVKQIADNIPLGQPILVGHHSEKHARKEAEKIETGMRKACRLWDQSEYWKNRARVAIGLAKYKERPDVRARRIKGLEADLRKHEKQKTAVEKLLKFWQQENISRDTALEFSNYFDRFDVLRPDGSHDWSAWSALDRNSISVEDLAKQRREGLPKHIERHQRWINHLNNRLTYEQAMLQSEGGTVTDKKGPEAGGACKCWASIRGGWSYIVKVNKVSVTVKDTWHNGGESFTRTIPFDKLSAIMSKAEVDKAKAEGLIVDYLDIGFHLIAYPESQKTEQKEQLEQPQEPAKDQNQNLKEDVRAMKDSLREGIKIVSAPQLFPTPMEIAHRMVVMAEIYPFHRVLEPSAGTGNLLKAIGAEPDKVAVEISYDMARALFQGGAPAKTQVINADFLEVYKELGEFDRIVINPPFENGADIKHIMCAISLLKPTGILVALCANGPRQQAVLMPQADIWKELPQDSFKQEGTSVNVAIMKFRKPKIRTE